MVRHILFIAFTDSVSAEKMISVKNSFLQIPLTLMGFWLWSGGRIIAQKGKVLDLHTAL